MAAGVVKGFDSGTSPITPVSPKKSIASTVQVSSTQSECDMLDIRQIKFLAVKPPASVTALTVYGCQTVNGTYVLINDLGSSGVVTVVASVWTSLDYTKLAPHQFIQMKSDQTAANAVCVAST